MPRIYTYTAGDAQSHKELGKKLAELKPGHYIVSVKRNRPIRSLSSNRYYHAILNIIAIDTGYNHETLHELLKQKFNHEVIFLPKGGSQLLGKSTATLTSDEFAAYLNRVKAWALDEFAIVIPERESITQQRWDEIETTYEENQQG